MLARLAAVAITSARVLLNGSAPVLCLGGDYARSSFVGAQVKAVTSIRRRACELVMCGTGRRL